MEAQNILRNEDAHCGCVCGCAEDVVEIITALSCRGELSSCSVTLVRPLTCIDGRKQHPPGEDTAKLDHCRPRIYSNAAEDT